MNTAVVRGTVVRFTMRAIARLLGKKERILFGPDHHTIEGMSAMRIRWSSTLRTPGTFSAATRADSF